MGNKLGKIVPIESNEIKENIIDEQNDIQK